VHEPSHAAGDNKGDNEEDQGGEGGSLSLVVRPVEAVLTSPCLPLLCTSMRRRRRKKKNIGRRQAVIATVTDENDKEEDNDDNYDNNKGSKMACCLAVEAILAVAGVEAEINNQPEQTRGGDAGGQPWPWAAWRRKHQRWTTRALTIAWRWRQATIKQAADGRNNNPRRRRRWRWGRLRRIGSGS